MIVSLVLCLLCPAPPAAATGAARVLSFIDDSGRVVRTKVLPDAHRVQLRSGTIDLRQYSDQAMNMGAEPAALIVAFDSVLSTELKRALAATGAQVIGPLPPAAFMVRANSEVAAQISQLDDFVAMTRFQDQWKISQRVLSGAAMTEVEIVLFDHAAPDTTLNQVGQLGEVIALFPVLDRFIIHAVLPHAAVLQVASLADVEMIDGVSRGGRLNNEVRVVMQTEKQHFQANQAFYNPIYNIGVFGAGEIVTVADTGLDDHEVYADAGKIVANYPAPNSCVSTIGDEFNHGTGVVATLLGDKISNSGGFDSANDFDGLAIQASVVMQDIESEDGFCPTKDFAANLFTTAWQAGSMVHNNSWGHNGGTNESGGTYSWRSQMIDAHTSRELFREQVIIFAAGNAGASYPGGVYRPFTLSDEAHAKNAIAVGGSGNGNQRDSMYLYSSRGPANDCSPNPCADLQRVKPDVLAPAVNRVDTADTANYSAYSRFSGTSIAAPAIAAAAALIRDYFGQGIYPVTAADPRLGGAPSSALIKAMLVNSTVPIYDATGYTGNLTQNLAANAYPNYDQGYGRPVLDNVLEPAGYRKLKAFENDSTYISTGEIWQRTVHFEERWSASCNNLRVTLAWNDPKAALQAGPKLVNDLDLEVDFAGSTYKGNHRLTGNHTYDTANNVEDVFLPMGRRAPGIPLNPVVRVFGSSVPEGPQAFALVVTYGACSDNLPCEPPQGAGGCYRGPGDVIPGSNWEPIPTCADQIYSSTAYAGTGTAFPFCHGPAPICGTVSTKSQDCPAPGTL